MSELCNYICKAEANMKSLILVCWWFNRRTVKLMPQRNTPTKWERCVWSDWTWRPMVYIQRDWGLGRKSTAPRVSCLNKAQENLSVIIEKCNILSFNLKIFVLELIQFNFFIINLIGSDNTNQQWKISTENNECIFLQIPPVEERLYVNVRS